MEQAAAIAQGGIFMCWNSKLIFNFINVIDARRCEDSGQMALLPSPVMPSDGWVDYARHRNGTSRKMALSNAPIFLIRAKYNVETNASC